MKHSIRSTAHAAAMLAALTASVGFTENTRPLEIGDGLWATATK